MSVFGLVSSSYSIFTTQPRNFSAVQLLDNKELLHQSSFYLINILSSSSFYLGNVSFNNLGGRNVRGEMSGGNFLYSKVLIMTLTNLKRTQ